MAPVYKNANTDDITVGEMVSTSMAAERDSRMPERNIAAYTDDREHRTNLCTGMVVTALWGVSAMVKLAVECTPPSSITTSPSPSNWGSWCIRTNRSWSAPVWYKLLSASTSEEQSGPAS